MKFIPKAILSFLLLVSAVSAQIFGSQQVITTNADGATRVFAIDLDNDGDADVLTSSQFDDTISWHENQGGGTFGTQQVITTNAEGAYSVYATDLDNDGDADVLSASSTDNKIAWYENVGDGNGVSGGRFGPQQVISLNAVGVRCVIVTDLDGDGLGDVLYGARSLGKIAWHKNLGGGSFGLETTVSINMHQVHSVFSKDLDGDGDQDIIVAAHFNNVYWFENLGGGFGNEQSIVTAPGSGAGGMISGPNSVYATDLDGDGDSDVLWACRNNNTVAWSENTGDGVFAAQQLLNGPSGSPTGTQGASSVHAADLDGDGDTDVISASCSDDKIAWYENLGNGAFAPQQVLSTSADWPWSVFAIDMDGDGDADVLSASSNDDEIAWYENLTTYWRINMTETSSYDLQFDFIYGQPSTQYYAFYTLNTLNATSPYTGGFFGLHLHMSTIWDQLSLALAGDPIFGGMLDGSGTASTLYNQGGLTVLSGISVWAIALQELPTQPGVFEASPITEFTFL